MPSRKHVGSFTPSRWASLFAVGHTKLMKGFAVFVSALALCGVAHAGFDYVESPPGAGSLPGTTDVLSTAEQISESTTNLLSSISGALASAVPQSGTPQYEIDLYYLYIPDLSLFSALASGNPGDDLALFLFDNNGFGVMMNDDTTTDLFPALPMGTFGLGGFYYLGVSLGGVEAVDTVLAPVFQPGAFTDVRGGNGSRIDSFFDVFTRFSEAPFDYHVSLTGAGVAAAVPEPGTIVLVLVALVGLAAARRRASVRG